MCLTSLSPGPFTVSLIFEPDSFLVRRGVEGFVDVASLVHTVYMIISHDWLRDQL